jgi:prephenate dehydrogenase
VRRNSSRWDPVGIVGLGLLGGSLAKALRGRFPGRPLIGIEPNARTRSLARRDRVFDGLFARPSSELFHCRIVALCAPVPAIPRLVGPVSRAMQDGAILTDVGGVKEPIVAAARRRVRRGVSFVGTHPMFGGEEGGYAASRANAWKGGTVAVCLDGAEASAIETVARFHRALGARVVFCSAAEHDAAVAAVSQLPYVLASALALTAKGAGPLAPRLAGTGLADATRLAEFAYQIQGEAARANSHLPRAARSLEQNLRRLLDALAGPSGKSGVLFARARAARGSLMRNR